MNLTNRPWRKTSRAIAVMAALFLLSPGAGAQQTTPEAGDTVAGDAKIAGQDVPVPSRKKYVAPQYPVAAAAEGIRGIVIVRLTIGEDGRVLDARVTRSVPGLDEAALAAVRLWEYEVTKVAGQPVKVLLTQSITFALRLPDLQRELGVPELRSGGAPPVPASLATSETAAVTVTLGSDGEVVEAAVLDGNSVVGAALLRAVKSWRFMVSTTSDHPSFTIRAVWTPGPNPSLALKAFNYTPGAEKAAAARVPTGEVREPATPSAAGSPAPPAAVAGAGGEALPLPDDPRAKPTSPSAPDLPPDPSQDVETEVLPARPDPPAKEEGVSSVSDLLLGENIPDLTKGRRPVWPPLARLGSITGDVVVRFSVDLAGRTTVHSTEGHEMLKDSAMQAVETWLFRRTAIDRLNLVATFKYSADRSVAMIERVR